MAEVDAEKVAAHWSRRTAGPTANWWTNLRAKQEYNRRICGILLPNQMDGIAALLKSEANRTFERCLSVGCGKGKKEVHLVQNGIAAHVIGYDLSAGRIEVAKAHAADMGVADRIDFRVGDAFAEAKPGFDLVYWNSSLHHMADTRAAVQWSRDMLEEGGYFAMDEYVGPNQFQVSGPDLHLVNRFRESLPPRLFLREDGASMPVLFTRHRLSRPCRSDPSEAVDSAAILPAVREIFPGATVKLAGGLFYFLGLNGLFGNLKIDDECDRTLLEMALLLDQMTLRDPAANLYAAAVAQKLPA